MIEASCHCGNVNLVISESPASVTSCNCSICHRIGALWAYFNSQQVQVLNDNPTTCYLWGERTIAYHRCHSCGCTTHYTTTESDGNELIAVNFRMVSEMDVESIPVRRFDGALSWRYLDD